MCLIGSLFSMGVMGQISTSERSISDSIYRNPALKVRASQLSFPASIAQPL